MLGVKKEFIQGLLGKNDIFRSEKGQRYARAVEAFVQATLRKDTGAAIAHDEYERNLENYFPSFGSSQSTQADLHRQRTDALKSVIESSGPVTDSLFEEAAQILGDDWQEVGYVGSDTPVVTSEDVGGITGGVIGGALGGFTGPFAPLAVPLGAAAGTYLGRAAGQYFGSDDDFIESISPEANDVVDSLISGLGGTAFKIGSAGYKSYPWSYRKKSKTTRCKYN